MVKKRGLTITIITVIMIAGINIFLMVNKNNPLSSSISGNFIKDIPEPFGIKLSIIFFIVLWIALLGVVFSAYMNFLKHKKEEEKKSTIILSKYKKSSSETDLDSLYRILKEKGMLSVATVAKIFNISKDKALEWGMILEDHKIIVIEYPAFDDPELRIRKEGQEDGNSKE